MKSIKEYHDQFNEEEQEKLETLYQTIKEVVPEAEESISYGMPCFKWNKPIAYYAMYKKHLGFYPLPDTIVAFEGELKEYKTSKGAIQFPHSKDLPLDLIQRMVRFRINQIKDLK